MAGKRAGGRDYIISDSDKILDLLEYTIKTRVMSIQEYKVEKGVLFPLINI